MKDKTAAELIEEYEEYEEYELNKDEALEIAITNGIAQFLRENGFNTTNNDFVIKVWFEPDDYLEIIACLYTNDLQIAHYCEFAISTMLFFKLDGPLTELITFINDRYGNKPTRNNLDRGSNKITKRKRLRYRR